MTKMTHNLVKKDNKDLNYTDYKAIINTESGDVTVKRGESNWVYTQDGRAYKGEITWERYFALVKTTTDVRLVPNDEELVLTITITGE